ncbi:23S rRNA (adenine(1618)-N(6))-methyltransferase RlmF, partial [Neptuniibacter sp.]|uniref:23S rRNA (adenine(1618)-N(6))-methyltransferase RlmF n=1 Tax=Neptuniibacter sp. TaxID=1962643 RepID=UPI0026260076
MSKRTSNKGKSGLHVRNPHNGSYDFEKLCRVSPELKAFIYQAPNGRDSIKFSDPDAVKALNKALLKAFYQIEFWDLPAGYLCPPIPGRADYIHHLADLLGDANAGAIPQGGNIRGLDIGTGASVIYPILGSRSYGWSFIGSDIDPVSIATAEQISKFNPVLKKKIRCRLQKSQDNIFKGVIPQDERFDFTLCNPPFHASLAEATAGSKRKVRNLSKASGKEMPEKLELNFAGQGAELWCKGGEIAFVRKMIKESA